MPGDATPPSFPFPELPPKDGYERGRARPLSVDAPNVAVPQRISVDTLATAEPSHLANYEVGQVSPFTKVSENSLGPAIVGSEVSRLADSGDFPVLEIEPIKVVLNIREEGEVARREPQPQISEFSGAVQVIIGRPPSWILLRGMWVMAVIVSALIFLSWWIKYPDTIKAPVSVTGSNPPAKVVARQSGNLEALYVKDKQPISEGQIIGIIGGAANAERLLGLRERLKPLMPFLADDAAYVALSLEAEMSLGQVQESYAEFHALYRSYGAKLKDDYAGRSLEGLQEQYRQKEAQIGHMKQEVAAVERELSLGRQRFEAMQKLFAAGTVSAAEFRRAEEEYLGKQRLGASSSGRLIEEEIRLADYEKQIRALEHDRSDGLRDLRLRLRESFKGLLAEIEVWERDFVLRAPVSGLVSIYEFWNGSQFVEKGKEVCIVVPQSTSLVGLLSATGRGVGKVEAGQEVRIRFSDFPDKEFGVVVGKVRGVSLVPRDGTHQVSVELSYPLITSYGKEIPFKQDMAGEGTVVTKKVRLIGRVFNELRRALR